MKKLMVANWKMNKSLAECESFFKEFQTKYTGKRSAWIAPQFIHLSKTIDLSKGTSIRIGSQNISEHLDGAFTGEVSARSLKDLGGQFVILGHSERRQYFHESSQLVNLKIKSALKNQLSVIYCVGETLKERESGETLSVISNQLHLGLNDANLASECNLIIAYEPVWAIGTGKVATPDEAQKVHSYIRTVLQAKFPSFGNSVKILYGGSVKPENAQELLAQKDIDGALVGGASLKAKDFLALCDDK